MMSCSRRTAFVLCVSAFLVSSYAIYDLNSKLIVMTNSNQNYRRMTDKMSAQILSLRENEKLKEETCRKAVSDKSEALKKSESAYGKLNEMLSSVKRARESGDAELRKLSRSHSRQLEELNQLHTQLDSLSHDQKKLHHCQDEYEALLQMHQRLSDNLQTLQDEKSELERRLESSSKSDVLLPADLDKGKSLASPIVSSSPSPQKHNLEEPKLKIPGSPKISSSTTSRASLGSGALGVPVAAQPPAAFKINPSLNEVIPDMKKEDVVEAPKRPPYVFQRFKDKQKEHFEGNYLDRAEDHDMNEDFNDDVDYDNDKKVNLRQPILSNIKDEEVVFQPHQLHREPVAPNPIILSRKNAVHHQNREFLGGPISNRHRLGEV